MKKAMFDHPVDRALGETDRAKLRGRDIAPLLGGNRGSASLTKVLWWRSFVGHAVSVARRA
jgi:hypothetical protein